MHSKIPKENSRHRTRTAALLLEVGIPCHRIGFRQLCIAIPWYRRADSLSLSKELYPTIATKMQLTDGRAVEHGIRESIRHAWNHRNPEIWQKYFPESDKCPSNKAFLSIMAEYL